MEGWFLFVAAMLATGMFAGVLAGLLGVGGGIVVVPVLDATLGFLGVEPDIRMHVAIGTSLATIIPTSVAASLAHHRRGSLDCDIARDWGPFIAFGAVLGAWFASRVHSDVLAGVFALLSLAIAVQMIAFPQSRPLADSVPRGAWVKSIPAAIGALCSMVGIGGAAFSILAMRLFNRPVHSAVGTAALFGLFISVPAALGFVITGLDDPRVPPGNLGYVSLVGLALIAPTSMLLAPLGVRIAHAIAARRLTLLFGAFLSLSSARMLHGLIT